MARVTPQSSCDVAGRHNLLHISFGNRPVACCVQDKALDVCAQPADIGADPIGDEARGAGVDRQAFFRRPLLDPFRRFDASAGPEHSTTTAFEISCLVNERRLSTPAATTTRQHVSTWRFYVRLERLQISLSRIAVFLRIQEVLGVQQQHDAPRHHHRQGACGVNHLSGLSSRRRRADRR
jgi:hypothetical protein